MFLVPVPYLKNFPVLQAAPSAEEITEHGGCLFIIEHHKYIACEQIPAACISDSYWSTKKIKITLDFQSVWDKEEIISQKEKNENSC